MRFLAEHELLEHQHSVDARKYRLMRYNAGQKRSEHEEGLREEDKRNRHQKRISVDEELDQAGLVDQNVVS